MDKLYCLFLLILLSGCNEASHNFQKVTYSGQGKVITLPLPEFALPTTPCLKAARFNNQGILYYFNSSKRQILMYDIGTEELIHTIQLYRQGPNEVNGIMGFTVLKRDRVMISTYPQKLLTVNLEGEIVDVIDYKMSGKDGEFSRPITLNSYDNNDMKIFFALSELIFRYFYWNNFLCSYESIV